MKNFPDVIESRWAEWRLDDGEKNDSGILLGIRE